MEHGDSDSVNKESHTEMSIKTEVKTPVTSSAHIDIEINFNQLKRESGLLRSIKREPALFVKEEILKDGSQAGNEQQCVQGTTTPAGNDRVNEDCGTSLRGLLNIKHETEDIDIGPTVLQDMDIHYTINKNMSAGTGHNTIVDDCNKAMPYRVKKESLEDKVGASHKHSDQKMREGDYDKALLSLRQQMNLQQHCLHQQSTTRSIDFKCDTSIHKPHLHNSHINVNQQNSRKNAMKTSTIVVSNQDRDEKTKTKQKPFICDKGYSSKAEKFVPSHEVTKQVRIHAGEKPYPCDTCDSRFARKDYLIKHVRVHTGEKPYRCDTCDIRFKQSGSLIVHMRVHTGEKPYRCKTCDKRFISRGELTAHTRVHTGEKPYCCDTCDKRFKLRGQLTGHMKVHTDEKLYRCDTCDKRFKQRSSLFVHMRVHTGEKPYRCDTCDKRFTQRGQLTGHIRVHTGEKPYRCHTCDKRFKQIGSLIVHMRVHMGEKPYRCDTCDKRFTQRGELTAHMRVHTGEKLYRCDTCDARVARKSDLIKHMRVHSGDKPTRVTRVMHDLNDVMN